MSCLTRGLLLLPRAAFLHLISQGLQVASGNAGWIRPSHFTLSSPHNLAADTLPPFLASSTGPVSLTYLPGFIYVTSIYLLFFFFLLRKKEGGEKSFLLLLQTVGKNRAVKF